jgi:hypothetical protein
MRREIRGITVLKFQVHDLCGVLAETERLIQLFLYLPHRVEKEPASYFIRSCLISYHMLLNTDDCSNLHYSDD